MRAVLCTAAGNRQNQDRGFIFEEESKVVVCVADGVGGQSGGTQAAVMATEFVRMSASIADAAEACSEILRRMDVAIASDSVAGETTCALAVVMPEKIVGASVGDSGIWLIPEEGHHVDLTRSQPRKPFIGSGSVLPISFKHPRRAGFLLLATDGLLKYAAAARIIETCRLDPIEVAAQRLVELVRYPSGALPDDVTLILTKL